MPIADFIDLMEISEKDFSAESETVGGWSVEMLEKFPEPGDSFTYNDLQITVLAADERRVEKVLVKRIPESKNDE